jgi:hypothetical protein
MLGDLVLFPGFNFLGDFDFFSMVENDHWFLHFESSSWSFGCGTCSANEFSASSLISSRCEFEIGASRHTREESSRE